MHSIRLSSMLVLLLVLVGGCSRYDAQVANPKKVGKVDIEVELDDKLYLLTMDNVEDGTTLEKVLRNVKKPRFVISGKDTTAFVQDIAGRSTSATEGWLFRVDGKFATRGIGMTVLHPPTTITWEFGAMEE